MRNNGHEMFRSFRLRNASRQHLGAAGMQDFDGGESAQAGVHSGGDQSLRWSSGGPAEEMASGIIANPLTDTS